LNSDLHLLWDDPTTLKKVVNSTQKEIIMSIFCNSELLIPMDRISYDEQKNPYALGTEVLMKLAMGQMML
jgi:hypothetical protein